MSLFSSIMLIAAAAQPSQAWAIFNDKSTTRCTAALHETDKSTLNFSVFDPISQRLRTSGKTEQANTAYAKFRKTFEAIFSQTVEAHLKTAASPSEAVSVVERLSVPAAGDVLASLEKCAVQISGFGSPDYNDVVTPR